jgi:hypothetical protein
MSAGVAHAIAGYTAPVISSAHSVNWFVPPLSTSTRYSVHSPAAFCPLNELSNALRVEASVTVPGSALRPSGSHVPNNKPVAGFVTLRYV